MTVQNLIDRLEELVEKNPSLMTDEVVFHKPEDAIHGALLIAEHTGPAIFGKWTKKAYIGLPDFVKDPIDV